MEKPRRRARATPKKPPSAAAQLAAFLAQYTPEIGALARAAIAKMRARLPGAVVQVYNNYNALAVAFSPTERRSDIILSITLYPRWVSLFFARGAELPDPQHLLKGSGSTVRYIVLNAATALDNPAVGALITQAVQCARVPFDRTSPGHVVIKSIAKTRRPRRPPAS